MAKKKTMAKKKKRAKTYRVSAQLLADKGGATPASRRANRLELVESAGAEVDDDSRMTDAVLQATLQALAEPPGPRRGRKPAASMVALYEERLDGVAFWDPDAHGAGARPLRARRSAPPRLVAPEPVPVEAPEAEAPEKAERAGSAFGRALRKLGLRAGD